MQRISCSLLKLTYMVTFCRFLNYFQKQATLLPTRILMELLHVASSLPVDLQPSKVDLKIVVKNCFTLNSGRSLLLWSCFLSFRTLFLAS